LVRRPESRARLAGLDTAGVLGAGPGAGDPAPELRALTGGRGLDLVLDAVGGDLGASLAGALRPGGALARYGLLAGAQPARPRPDVRTVLFWLRRWVHDAGRERIAAALAEAAELVREG